MSVSASGIVFTGVFLAAALLIWGAAKAGRVGPGRLLLGAVLPALLLAACLVIALGQARFGEFRLTLNAVKADVTGQPLRLGGDPERDDIVTEGLQAGLLTVETPETADARPRLRATAPPPGRPVQLVAVERGFKRLEVLGSIPIRGGDAICLSECEGEGARWYRFDASGRLDPGELEHGQVEVHGHGRAMPRRAVLRLIPGLVFWTPTQAIQPLRDFLPPSPQARAQQGFLFQDGGVGLGLGGARWRLVLPDREARILRRGGAPEPLRPDLTVDLPARGELKAVLLEARFYDLPADAPGRRGRLVERRSARLGLDDQDWVVARLDTPATTVLGTCPGNGDMNAARILTARAAASSTVVSLPSLGGAAAAAAEGALPLPDPGACAEFTRGALERGEPADGRTVQLKIERLAFPWIALVVALAWALLSWRLQARLLGERSVAWSLVFALQLLLGVRVLVGLSGAAVDVTLAPDRLLADSLTAYVAAPALFLAFSPRGAAPWPAWGGLALFVAAVLAGVMQAAQRPTAFVLALVALAVAAAAFQLVANLRAAAGPATGTRLGGLGVRLPPLWPRGGLWERLRAEPWMALLALAVLLRLGLALAGVKERLFIAVSAVYTPLLILGFAGMIAAAARALPPPDEPLPPRLQDRLGWAARRWAWPGGFALLLFVTAVLLPMFVSDTGYALTTLLPLAAVGAWRLGVLSDSPLPPRRRWAWSAPAAAVAAAFLAVFLIGAVSNWSLSAASIHAAGDPSVDDRAALAILGTAAGIDDNRARLLQFVAPERLTAVGAASTENLRVLAAHLSDYTSPPLGRGYMRNAPLGAIVAPVHLSDNVSAVHLMSDFGRVSAAAYLALLAVLTAACARLTRARGSDPRRLAGLLALSVLFGVAAYVILANLQLVLFTGRNVYLMAAASGSDLLEGLTLFALAFFGLAGLREARNG
ncbi:MAG: hypothetical protein K1X35_14665 [Caulobacteraceae bacterium]|nr:hypothetical protein [Caulobacteraceae bacterium]